MQTITALVPAKNEEKNIERCLKSLSWCDKIVVIVTGTDKTAQIAKKIGAIVVNKPSTHNDDFEELQRNINWAGEHAITDWILRIDADEVVTEELKKEISELMTLKPSDNIVAYGIPRIPNFLGTFLKGGDWAYDRLVRLYKPKFCYYEPIVKVHEQFKVVGKIGYLKNSLLHYSHPDRKTLMKKFESYTTLEAKELHDNRVSAIVKLFCIPPYVFLRWMIYHHGYRDGWVGIQAAAARAYYDVLLYSKYLSRKTG